MLANISISIKANKLVCFDNKSNRFYHYNDARIFFNQIDIKKKILVCNKQDIINQRLLFNADNCCDILELIAFLFPKNTISLNIFSIYNFLSEDYLEKSISIEDNLKQEAKLIFRVLELLKNHIKSLTKEEQKQIFSLVSFMKEDGFTFADFILEQLDSSLKFSRKYINIWESLKSFKEEDSIDEIDTNLPINKISNKNVLKKLDDLTKEFSFQRNSQKEYALFVSDMFSEQENINHNIMLAQAGTGIGKTIGYLSSILSFIENNPKHQVLISTYSKALQRQIKKDLKKAFNQKDFIKKVALIKGAGNYVCLLNYQSLLNNYGLFPKSKIFLGFIARAILLNSDGDLIGGDLNPIIFEIFASSMINYILNKRDECSYARCRHYKKCFIMQKRYEASRANILISNHSFSLLSLHNGSLKPKYIVFDEAHHLFDTSDDVFSQNIGNKSLYSLKHWVQGNSSRYARAKGDLNGFRARINIFISNESKTEEEKVINLTLDSLITTLVSSFNIFPNEGAIERIKMHNFSNSSEGFLYYLYLYVLLANDDLNKYYSIESQVIKERISKEFKEIILKFQKDLNKILSISNKIYNLLVQKMLYIEEEDAKSLGDIIRSFEGFCIFTISNYIKMLEEIFQLDENFIYRFMIEREEGNITDIAYYKNFLDPMMPFSTEILNNTKGITFTSATLGSNNIREEGKDKLIKRFGLEYLEEAYIESIGLKSPFNYERNARIYIVDDNFKNNMNGLSRAILELFKASKGGGLAIFTAVNRLKQVYNKINKGLIEEDIMLLAQHINKQKMANLIDIFKEDINSSMLGTDSARDGIDIPGDSLRLVLYEKIPWSKPDILVKKRVEIFGKDFSNDLIYKKLSQGFGRLIRKEDDKGVFILLDKRVPSEFLSSFPEDINIVKAPLSDVIKEVKNFFKQ